MCLPAFIAAVRVAARSDWSSARRSTMSIVAVVDHARRGRWSSARPRAARRSRATLSALRPTRIGSTCTRVPSRERDAALLADRQDRADQVLAVPHPAGDAVHRDAQGGRVRPPMGTRPRRRGRGNALSSLSTHRRPRSTRRGAGAGARRGSASRGAHGRRGTAVAVAPGRRRRPPRPPSSAVGQAARAGRPAASASWRGQRVVERRPAGRRRRARPRRRAHVGHPRGDGRARPLRDRARGEPVAHGAEQAVRQLLRAVHRHLHRGVPGGRVGEPVQHLVAVRAPGPCRRARRAWAARPRRPARGPQPRRSGSATASAIVTYPRSAPR